jgi:Pentapeptide repeats (9 copies)
MNSGWPTCLRGEGSPCSGVRVGHRDACWAHLDAAEEEDALHDVSPGDNLDLRGTEVLPSLLASILDRMRVSREGKAQVGCARCERASFPQGASFDETIFLHDANFSGAVFGGIGTFADAEFSGSASFDNSRFEVATFGGARFAGRVSFVDACVMTGLRLEPAQIGGPLALDGMRAAGQVDVAAKVAKASCARGLFSGRATLRLAGSELCLTDTVFEQSARVESLAGNGDGVVSVRSLRGVDAEHLTLADADLRRCFIYGLRRPEQLRLAGHITFEPTPRIWYFRWGWLPWRWTNRDALYEEHLWRQRSKRFAAIWTGVDTAQDQTEPSPGPALLAVLYRQLRQAVEDARNEPGAADLYYGEMEMRRLSTERSDERLLLTLYWLVSGYGLRASRSLFLLAALILLAALGMQRAGFPGVTHGYVDCLLYAGGSVLSLDLTGHLGTALTDWGQLIRITLRVCGPVLLGLAALAVRGRIKR